MSLKIVQTESARSDLREIVVFLTEQSGKDTARRLRGAIKQAFDLLADNPGIGSPRDYGRPGLNGLRMLPVPHYSNYLIFYRPAETTLQIIRVLHGARNVERVMQKSD